WWANNTFEEDSLTHKTKFVFQTGGKPTPSMIMLMGLVDQFLDKPYINKHQVYIGGLSMGGMGTLEILRREPKKFAAAFSICGGDKTENLKKYATKVPLCIFHGKKDSVVPYTHSEVVVAAIKDTGG